MSGNTGLVYRVQEFPGLAFLLRSPIVQKLVDSWSSCCQKRCVCVAASVILFLCFCYSFFNQTLLIGLYTLPVILYSHMAYFFHNWNFILVCAILSQVLNFIFPFLTCTKIQQCHRFMLFGEKLLCCLIQTSSNLIGLALSNKSVSKSL